MSKQVVLASYPPYQVAYQAPTVDYRLSWSDDWELLADIHPLEATWCSSPAMPLAALRLRYGHILKSGSKAFEVVNKNAGPSLASFVKLTYPMKLVENPDTHKLEMKYRYWYGVADLKEDDLDGVEFWHSKNGVVAIARGQLITTCYGLEKLLENWPIRTSFIDVAGAATEINRALTFNRGGRPNRNNARVDGTYLFEPDSDIAHYWSTRDVVEYLLARQTPKDAAGDVLVPFVLGGVGLPDWDRSETVQEQASTLSILSEIVQRRHMLMWRLTVDEETTPHNVVFEVMSATKDAIVLPLAGSPKIEANTRQKSLVFDGDVLTTAQLKDSGVVWYDQVIVRGARQLSIGSFSYADGTLAAGWGSGHQVLYDAGASTTAGYAALDDEEKRRRNGEARSAPKLEEVYACFKIEVGWNRKVKNGEGTAENPLFPDPDAPGGNQPGYYAEMFVQPTLLPLYQGIDYSDDKIANGSMQVLTTTTNLEPMPPVVAFKRPGTSRWVAADKMGHVGTHTRIDATENNTFSCSVQVPHESHGVLVRTSNDAQHAIAPTEFGTGLPVDEKYGNYNWRSMIVTIALPWDTHVEGKYPEELPEDVEAPRIKILEAGDRYRKDYVAPGTVLDVKADGTLVRSTGGWIPKEGDTDDQTHLNSLAKLAYSHYGRRHRVLYVTTPRLIPTEDLDVGDLITDIGDPVADGGHRDTINVVITQIKISWPDADNGAVPTPKLIINTDAGELDAIDTSGDQSLRFRNLPVPIHVPVNRGGPNAPVFA